MKLRIALALCALATPLCAQSLPAPNLGTGTKLNGANLQNAATKATGTSVADPGTGALEALLPVQTFTGASHAFVTADLYKETRRLNSGSAMSDTFPGTSATGLVNGTTIQLNNVDASASVTIAAGSGTTIDGATSVVIGPLRSTKWVYDAPAANWRSTMNSLTSVLGPSSATSGNIATFSGTSGALIQDSGKALPSGAVAGTSDTQTLANKTLDTAAPNTIRVNGVTLSPGEYPGTLTNDSATAGNVGEYRESSVASGAPVSLANSIPANLASISLPAGDWDLTCSAVFVPGGTTTATAFAVYISATGGTVDQAPGAFGQINMPSGTTLGVSYNVVQAGPRRVTLSGTASYYCVVLGVFGTSTLSVWGNFRARRAR